MRARQLSSSAGVEELIAFVVRHAACLQRHAHPAARRVHRAPARSRARTPRATARSAAAAAASPAASSSRDAHDVIARDGAEHGARLGLARLAAAEGDQLIEQRQRVAHAAVGRLRHAAAAPRPRTAHLLGLRMCCRCAAISATGRRLRLNCRQRDSTVTGSFCGSVVASRNLTCGGGSSSVLSSALKECVDEHVHFVDEVHLVAAAGGRVLHVVEQLARVIDLGARGGIDFDEIDEAPASISRQLAQCRTASARHAASRS